MSRKVRSTVVLLMLTLFLGTGAAQALPLEGPNSGRASGMLVAVWDWVISLLEVDAPFRAMHEASSGTRPEPPPSTNGSNGGEHGGFIDPNGNH